MKKTLILALLAFTLLISHNANAVSANYIGVVDRVSLLKANGSFVVTLDSGQLDDCQYKYAFFMVDQLGAEATKMAYSMMLTSISTKMKVNLVIDKEQKGPNGECYINGMISGIQSYD